jgi:hypothetical protein
LNPLKCSRTGLLPDQLLRISQDACKSAYKLFAILVCLNKGDSFCSFLQEGLCDEDLPFDLSQDVEMGLNLHSSRTPGKPIQSVRSWEPYQVRGFSRSQWQMLAPIFKKSNQVEHYEFLDNHVLPFVEDYRRDLPSSGAFATMTTVVIHPAHQFIYRSANPDVGEMRVYVHVVRLTDVVGHQPTPSNQTAIFD